MPAPVVLTNDIAWASKIFSHRSHHTEDDIRLHPDLAPQQQADDSGYSRFLSEHAQTYEERLLLVMTIMPYLEPSMLTDKLESMKRMLPQHVSPSTLGLVRGRLYEGILPTAYLLIYLVGGLNLAVRMEITRKIISGEYHLLATGLVHMQEPLAPEPPLTGYFSLPKETLYKLLQ